MAKRYIRMNWQNSPSTVTPISAENLNKMDKGIDDVDSALEDHISSIIHTDTINDVTKYPSSAVTYGLGQEIDTINNNLSNKTGKTYQGTVTGDFKNTVQENWSSIPVGMSLCLLAQSSLAGATVFKQGDSHGTVLIMPYTEPNPTYGRLSNGTWTWKTVTLA